MKLTADHKNTESHFPRKCDKPSTWRKQFWLPRLSIYFISNQVVSTERSCFLQFGQSTMQRFGDGVDSSLSNLKRVHPFLRARDLSIHSRCEFHQHFVCDFFVQKCYVQLFFSYTVWIYNFLAQEYLHKSCS